MLISLNWLKKYVDIKEDTKEIMNTLTMIGQEVEAVTILGEGLDNVVIGHIVEYKMHPDSDHMTVCKVDIGAGEPLQIVCGAPNHREGDKVVVAKEGAVLSGNFKIKRAMKRGIESCGMLCSEAELGIGKGAEGIVILPKDAPIGEEYRKYANLDDVIFELEITPNRPDCLSYIGIAREYAAYYKRRVKYPIPRVQEIIEENVNITKVTVEDKARCPRYMGRVIRNIEIKESPEWLKTHIRAMGLNPINNIVDITNFVMFEYNIPMHAFDFDSLDGGCVVVRGAQKGEKLLTLDGIERKLDNNELVIADEHKPMALAGIIGGDPSKITDNTKNIFLEVACFEPENIRRTAKNLGITTDASYRNQRGTDMMSIPDVVKRATELLVEVAGGDVLRDPIDVISTEAAKEKEVEIPLDIDIFNKFAGKKIDDNDIMDILTSLNIYVKSVDKNKLVLCPPSYRDDLRCAADIYEEIIRMYGFGNIPDHMPVEDISSGSKEGHIALQDDARKALMESGLHEVINYSFIPKASLDIMGITDKVVEIKNPLSEEMNVLRPSLIYSLLVNVRDNFNRNIEDVKIFEVSKVFVKGEELANETARACIVLAGSSDKTLWDSKPKAYDFYDLKGYVEEFMRAMGVKKYTIARSTNPMFHPGRSADIKKGKEVLCTFGEIHPNIAEALDIKKYRALVADIALQQMDVYRDTKKVYEPIVKYPEVSRDLAVVLDKTLLVGDIVNEIKKASKNIEKVDIFDVYHGENIGADKMSVAFSIVFRCKDRTLTDDEVKADMDKILGTISKKYHGEIRQ